MALPEIGSFEGSSQAELKMSSSAEMFEVQNILGCYMRALDANDYPQMLGLLTEDVELRMGGVGNGKAEVAQVLANRSTDRCTRHLISNFFITPTADGYRADFRLSGISHPLQEGETSPYAMTGTWAIADMVAEFRREAGALRMCLLVAQPVFMDK
jgi:hypothetical protein